MFLVGWTIRPPWPSKYFSLTNQSIFLYFFTPLSHTLYTYRYILNVEKFSVVPLTNDLEITHTPTSLSASPGPVWKQTLSNLNEHNQGSKSLRRSKEMRCATTYSTAIKIQHTSPSSSLSSVARFESELLYMHIFGQTMFLIPTPLLLLLLSGYQM